MAGIGGQIPGGGNNFRPPTTNAGKATSKPVNADALKASAEANVPEAEAPAVAQPTAASEKALKAGQDGMAVLGKSQITSAVGLAGVQAVKKLEQAIPAGGARDQLLDKLANKIAAKDPAFQGLDEIGQALYLSDIRMSVMEDFSKQFGLT
jgi:hypothetical protein